MYWCFERKPHNPFLIIGASKRCLHIFSYQNGREGDICTAKTSWPSEKKDLENIDIHKDFMAIHFIMRPVF